MASDFDTEWKRLAETLPLPAAASERLGSELAARHGEQRRRYHTAHHVEAVIEHLDALDARSPVTLLTAFFHDAIYDPRAGDNEERSADLAAAWLVGVPEVTAVVEIVHATAGHQLPSEPPDGCAAFLDADLAILGAHSATYDWYASAIRAEYAHVPDDDFRQGRARVLRGFLERPVLYFTDRGRRLWEAPARANLSRELTEME